MTTTPVPSILHYLRTCLGPSDGGPAPDAHLLQCFAHGHDEVAFRPCCAAMALWCWGLLSSVQQVCFR